MAFTAVILAANNGCHSMNPLPTNIGHLPIKPYQKPAPETPVETRKEIYSHHFVRSVATSHGVPSSTRIDGLIYSPLLLEQYYRESGDIKSANMVRTGSRVFWTGTLMTLSGLVYVGARTIPTLFQDSASHPLTVSVWDWVGGGSLVAGLGITLSGLYIWTLPAIPSFNQYLRQDLEISLESDLSGPLLAAHWRF